LGIDTRAAIKGVLGAESLAMAESLARLMAYSREEAQAALERSPDQLQPQGELITVESETLLKRGLFDRWAARL
jgi:hypothetical protein